MDSAAGFSNLDNVDNMGDAGKHRRPARRTHFTTNVLHHADILLIGPRASGKTTLGQLIAHEFNRAFADLDVEALRGFAEPTIALVWQAHGEAAWRCAETQALQRLLSDHATGHRQPMVIALGGGAPIVPAIAEMLMQTRMRGRALTVYLACAADTLQRRLRIAGEAGQSRPALIGNDAVAEVPDVLAQREPTYRRLADIVIDANQPSAQATLKQFIAALRQS